MPVRNEEWCLGLTLRAALMWCEAVVVLNHASTDRTADIIKQVFAEDPSRVLSISHLHECWTEMAHRQQMLELARRLGATHIAMIDADEVLTGNLLPEIQNRVLCIRDGETLQLPWLALPRSANYYITEGIWGAGQQVSMAFKDEPAAHWATRNSYDFHHRNPMGLPAGRFAQPLKPERGGIMHLQFLNERRLRAKQALYQATEVLRWPGRKKPKDLAAMYGRAVYESTPSVGAKAVPSSWWAPYSKWMQYLDLSEDKEPWQETEIRRLVAFHGREHFAGLDFFGIV